MYQEKIDTAESAPTSAPFEMECGRSSKPNAAARFWSVLVVVSLPAILVWLLIDFVWRDIRAVMRGIHVFYRAVAEELSRS